MRNNNHQASDDLYLPELFSLGTDRGAEQYEKLLKGHPELFIHDLFHLQKKELIKTRNPNRVLKDEELDSLYKEWLADRDVFKEGVWVYYPWLNKLIHTLCREEFIELRTNRNCYKISHEEQAKLAQKQVGIIGLSVGHAVALCLATERVCGKLKLADFDHIDLSNLNRIKTSILNIGINKCIVTAREIAELDPFIEVECFTEGINEDNIRDFLLEGGKLDVLVDECDSIDIKIRCRQEAKKYEIPVVMETSDRGMLDVERYDLEKNRPILHGLLSGIPLDKLKNLSNEEKIPLVLKIADVRKGSLRGKVSMLEVGQSISTWPQLASAVTLGGGVVTDVCRRILLNQYHESGRYYIDLESLAGNTNLIASSVIPENPHQPFDPSVASEVLEQLPPVKGSVTPGTHQLEEMVEAACLAPSTGNDQPWKWVYKNGRLLLFHDAFRSYSFGDYHNNASYISLGAAYENLCLKSYQLGFNIKPELFPLPGNNQLVAATCFFERGAKSELNAPYLPGLAGVIATRCTNRNPSSASPVPAGDLALLVAAAESVPGAKIQCFTKQEDILALGRIIGECDRIRLLNAEGHKDFVEREMRWSVEEAIEKRDGIDIRTLGVSGPLLAALSIIKDREVTECLKMINGGKALVDAAIRTAVTSSLIGIITLPKYSKEHFFAGGIAMQRLWLQATQLGYSLHPLISPLYLFPRLLKGNGAGLDRKEIEKLKNLRSDFERIVPLNENEAEVFMFKIASAPEPTVKTLRLPLKETLFVINK